MVKFLMFIRVRTAFLLEFVIFKTEDIIEESSKELHLTDMDNFFQMMETIIPVHGSPIPQKAWEYTWISKVANTKDSSQVLSNAELLHFRMEV